MREIKFRAWNQFRQEMNKVLNIGWFDGIYMNISVDTEEGQIDYYDTHDNYECDDIKLMQYTRLKDKNGKEIYEGDIVEYANKYRYIICFGEYNKNPMHCAEAIVIGFYLREIKTKTVEELYSINGTGARFPAHCAENEEGAKSFELEVIGNIYDNSELLKKEG